MRRFGERGRERFLGLAGDELGELGDEAGEIERAAAVGGAGLFHEFLQVGEFAVAEEFGQERGVVAGAGECFAEERGDRDRGLCGCGEAASVWAAATTLIRSSVESCVRWIGGEEAVVERAAGFDEPVQRFIGERKEGAAEDAGEADFVGRAGDGAEQIEDVEDFLLGVKGVAADDVVVEAIVAEGGFVDVDVAQRAEQDGDVAELERARAAGGRSGRR